jgi:RNA polymerase sigma-70 factor, ECF subfamily
MAGREVVHTDARAMPEPHDGGDRSSAQAPTFHAVYEEYFDFVWSCAARFAVAPSAIDDLVQEVFVVIHARLHTLRNPDALRSWIYGVVRRMASHHRRALRTQAAAALQLRSEGSVSSSAPTPLEQVERCFELSLLERLLQELDEPKREMFALVELNELTVPEAAATLNIPLNTAYSRLRAARLAFEHALARHHARGDRT